MEPRTLEGWRASDASEDRRPQDLDARMQDLLRIVGNVARGDFSEKPVIDERDDDIARLTVGLRFMIEDLERAHLERAREIDRLTEMGRSKTQFARTAAHELRTPLTPVVLHLRLLRSGRLGEVNERQERSLDVLERNIGRLRKLVEDMLDASLLDAGQLAISHSPFDLDRVVREALEEFRGAAEESGLVLEEGPVEPLRVSGDARRLGRVLASLLGNAFKFTPRGGSVRIEAVREGPLAVVRVRDSGAGFTAVQAARLFQPFEQVHAVNDASNPGSGLGLYIARGVLEQHGGRIWCDSAGPGKGSTFSFSLPLAADPGSAPLRGPPRLAARPQAKPQGDHRV